MKLQSLQFLLLSLHNRNLWRRTTSHNIISFRKEEPVCFPRLSFHLASKGHSNESQFEPCSCSIKNAPFVSSRGWTANFMLFWPSITTFTLIRGWDDEATESLTDAVNKVVEENKVLTGTASKDGAMNNAKIVITPGAYVPGEHEFVNKISSRKDIQIPNFANIDRSAILAFMDKFIAPMIPKAESVIESISTQSPLFCVDLIFLGNDYVCYVVKMSHCIGDGVTYFKIMDQINNYFNHNGRKKHFDSIDWTNDAIPQHEIFPKTFSKRDTHIMYGIPFLLGLLKNTWNIKKQRKGYFILCKKKIQEKKKHYIKLFQSNVSTNDIITSALCEANLSTSIFAFTMNMRGLHCNYGGNYHTEIPFLKSSVLSNEGNQAVPTSFRNILKKGWYYDTDEIPICPFVLGMVGRISSLATIQKLISTDEMDVVCHTMLSSFVSNVPMDTAFISSMDNETYVVLHNFREVKSGGLLDEITFKR